MKATQVSMVECAAGETVPVYRIGHTEQCWECGRDTDRIVFPVPGYRWSCVGCVESAAEFQREFGEAVA